MLDFTYYAPTKVYFGKGKQKEIGKILKEYGYKKIMMQYGQNSIKKSGLYGEVMASLKENDIDVVEMGGVEPNPKVSFVREAVKIANRFAFIFGMPAKVGNSSIFAGTALEVMKTPYLGKNGHIAIRTNYIDRAVNYMESVFGVKFNEESAKRDAKGNLKAIYLDEEIGGFAVHLVQK